MSIIPPSVCCIQYLLKFRLFSMACLVLITALVLHYKPEKGFWTDFVDAVLYYNDISENDAYSLGNTIAHLVWKNIFSALAIIFAYAFLNGKKALGFWICIAFDFIFIIINNSIPILPIIIFILGINKNTRIYFAEIISKKELNILDDDTFQ